MKQSILIVEDDLDLGFLLMEHLESEGFVVKLCRDGQKGWNQFNKQKYDLCILDIMVPYLDGFSLAQKIKRCTNQVPFLFLTARTLKEDVLRGYQIGADDYITKPFDIDELVCKIQVIFRRKLQEQETQPFTSASIGKYYFDYTRQELCLGEQIVRLTEKENEVLKLLCQHKNQILRRDLALEKIYGKRDYFLGRSFDVFISRIRKLLKDDEDVWIENVFKVGFILNVKV